MTPTELRAALDDLDLPRAELARLCGVTRETVYRWLREEGEKGAIPVPQYAVTILDQRRIIRRLDTMLHEAEDVA